MSIFWLPVVRLSALPRIAAELVAAFAMFGFSPAHAQSPKLALHEGSFHSQSA